MATSPVQKPVHEVIVDAMMKVLESADSLVDEYTRTDASYGTLPRMEAAENALIRDVRAWRAVCRGRP
jgi:hypothetical protein